MDKGFLLRSFELKAAAGILGVTVGTTATLGAIATGSLACAAVAVTSSAVAGWGYYQMAHHDV